MLKKIINMLAGGRMYVTADPTDGSLTLSEKLYRKMDKDADGQLDDVFCFQANDKDEHYYGFIVNPYKTLFSDQADKRDRPTAQIQYNCKTKTVGFMPTNPTLALMYYNWGMDAGQKARLSVKRAKLPGGTTFYKIIK